MPIEPVMVDGSAKITSAGSEIQYPPLAAKLAIETITGIFFAFAASMASRIFSDAMTDPPGESTRTTSAFKSLLSKAS